MSVTGVTTLKEASRLARLRLEELVAAATSLELRRRVLDVLNRLASDRYLEETKGILQQTLEQRTPYWDMCGALAAVSERLQPERYFEIGVRRGRSAAVVAAFHPDVSLYLFDMWHPDYAGVPNPGPEFVRGQLERVGHRGTVRFIDGRSQDTVPAFLQDPACPTAFELMTVDGDHRDAGARTDLDNVLPRLAVGGVLVFDDIGHPTYPTLLDTWRSCVVAHPELVTFENRSDATGTAMALRAC